jgi:hypothetical protein
VGDLLDTERISGSFLRIAVCRGFPFGQPNFVLKSRNGAWQPGERTAPVGTKLYFEFGFANVLTQRLWHDQPRRIAPVSLLQISNLTSHLRPVL